MAPLMLNELRNVHGFDCKPSLSIRVPSDFSAIGAFPSGYGPSNRCDYTVECVLAGTEAGYGQEGTDEVPDAINARCQHNMHVCQVKKAYVAVLIGGNDFRVYQVPYRPEIMAQIIPIIEAFWEQHLIPRRLPEPDYKHPATLDAVKTVMRLQSGLELHVEEPDSPLQDAVRWYENLRKEEAKVKRQKDEAKARLKAHSGGASLITFPDGTSVVISEHHRSEYTVPATTYEKIKIDWRGDS